MRDENQVIHPGRSGDDGDAALDAALAAADDDLLAAISNGLDLDKGLARMLEDLGGSPADPGNDRFLAGPIPQVAEQLAEQRAADVNGEADRARFLTWPAAHTEGPAGAPEDAQAEWGLAEPASARPAMPPQILKELLSSHPEAASLLAEASRCRALARSSAASAARESAAAQAARLGYEELWHRLDPHHRRTVPFGAGLVVLVVLVVGIFVELLPAALHSFGLGLGWPAAWGHTRGNPASGFLISVFALVLAAGAATLISRMEPASLLVARRRWQRARGAHEAAVQAGQADLEAASAATVAWLGLVRTQASSGPDSGTYAVDETVALAAALLEATANDPISK
jgi:hypothetical protein